MKKAILMLLPNGFDPDRRVHQEAVSLIKAGYEVTILAWDRESKYPQNEVIDGIKVERIAIRSSYGKGTAQLPLLLYYWIKVFFVSQRKRFDLIHCHDFNTLPVGFLIGKLRRKPIIFDAHESYHEMLGPNVLPIIKRSIAFVERILIKRIDVVITVGNILEEEYKRRGARLTSVVGNWKSLEEFQISSERGVREKEKLNIPKDKLIVCYIGFLLNGRGLLELIEAVKETESVYLILGGKGQIEKKIRELMTGQSNITFLGFVHPRMIPLYTALSDVIYYGIESDYGNNRYSAPNKLFEALAAGRAIITGNIGEIAKIVKEERCGLSLGEINKISLLSAFETLRNKALLSEYKKNALDAGVNRYNWSNAEKTLLSVYDSISAVE